jgi:RNA polymerase sigma-70 factor (ECF subfamily)
VKPGASSSPDSIVDLLLLSPDAGTAARPASRTGAAADEAQVDVLAQFDRWAPRLLRYVASCGLGREDAEDVVQDTFLALFLHLSLGRDRTNVPGWLYRVAHNLALKRRRAIQRQPTYGSRDDLASQRIDPALDPEARLVLDDRRRRLRAVVGALSDRDRQCLQLRAEGRTYRDIAAALRLSLGSVAKSITRALARLTRADGR